MKATYGNDEEEEEVEKAPIQKEDKDVDELANTLEKLTAEDKEEDIKELEKNEKKPSNKAAKTNPTSNT